MKAQQALAPTESARMEKATGSPLFVEAGALIERMEELTKSVARRAYEFFEARGRQFGSEFGGGWGAAEPLGQLRGRGPQP